MAKIVLEISLEFVATLGIVDPYPISCAVNAKMALLGRLIYPYTLHPKPWEPLLLGAHVLL